MKAAFLTTVTALLSLSLLSIPLPVLAARPKLKTHKTKRSLAAEAEKEDAVEEKSPALKPRPLDILQQEISKNHKSKRARSLKKAYEALRSKKFPLAIQLATSSQSDPAFSDYGNWIAAAAQSSQGRVDLEAKKYNEATRAAEAALALDLRIESKSPYSPMLKNLARDMGLAEVLKGDAQAGVKKWRSAQDAFERGFQRLATHGALGLVRPDSLQNYAQSCSSHETELCMAWVRRFSAYYPKNSEEMRAVLRVFPSAGDRPRSAATSKATQSYKAPDLDVASFEQNMALYLDGKFGAAVKGFRQFVDEFPKSTYRFRARYWLGQALTHDQDHEKAQKSYEALQHDTPLTYYGLLAGFAGGKGMDAPITQAVPLAVERDPLLQPHELLRVQRAENFIAEGAFDLAAIELKELKARDTLSAPFLMYLAALNAQAHAFSSAFSLMSDLIARGYEGATSATFLAMVFPVEHFETIKKYAESYGLDPILVLSLIKQESAFETSAISSSGALGLMQLMPATATDTDPRVERASLIEAESNIRVGAKYLAQLMKRFNGNIVLSLASYNAGPSAADRWYKESGGKRGMLEFIETIPYKETREYVASIVRNYYWYSRKLTPNEPVKALTYFWGEQGATPSPKAVASPEPSAAPDPASDET